jgi:hypothetical protein
MRFVNAAASVPPACFNIPFAVLERSDRSSFRLCVELVINFNLKFEFDIELWEDEVGRSCEMIAWLTLQCD